MADTLKVQFRKLISKIYSYSKIYLDCFWLNKFIKNNSITLILDVGANSGQFALSLRRFGYKKKILSFEPGHDAFQKLLKNSERDNKWSVFDKVGLSNKSGKVKLNISKNSVSSSLKSIKQIHKIHQPDSKYIKSEVTRILKLDNIFKKFYKKRNYNAQN